LQAKELLIFYENQFHRIFSEVKNEIQFLKNVQAAADKDNKPDISLGLVFIFISSSYLLDQKWLDSSLSTN